MKLKKILAACLVLLSFNADSNYRIPLKEYKSEHLNSTIFVDATSHLPYQSENQIFPYMEKNKKLFSGAEVLDIGTGSGIIGLYAAKLGAKRVVATDIDKNAIYVTGLNKKKLGFDAIIYPRLVPLEDSSAYSVIKEEERFDIIIANPPGAMDIDSAANNSRVDTGNLGISIIDGLSKRLKKGGKLVLLYNNLFYHQFLLTYARSKGFYGKSFGAIQVGERELTALLRSYMREVNQHFKLKISDKVIKNSFNHLPYTIVLKSNHAPDTLGLIVITLDPQ